MKMQSQLEQIVVETQLGGKYASNLVTIDTQQLVCDFSSYKEQLRHNDEFSLYIITTSCHDVAQALKSIIN